MMESKLAPEQRAASVELARLRLEVAEDRGAMERCVEDARESQAKLSATSPERPWLAVAGVALHGWYTGFETAIERVARAVDQNVPTGNTWHRALLSQAMVEVPGVRPTVIPRELHRDLAELLEFRHFFRHAYGVNLDAERLRRNVDRLLQLAPLVSAALDTFDEFLKTAQEAVRE